MGLPILVCEWASPFAEPRRIPVPSKPTAYSGLKVTYCPERANKPRRRRGRNHLLAPPPAGPYPHNHLGGYVDRWVEMLVLLYGWDLGPNLVTT